MSLSRSKLNGFERCRSPERDRQPRQLILSSIGRQDSACWPRSSCCFERSGCSVADTEPSGSRTSRQQLSVLRRTVSRPQLRTGDRLFWVLLAKAWPDWRTALIVVQPDTVARWHRHWLRRRWTQRSTRTRPGRPSTAAAIRTLVDQMTEANPLWGAPRIHGELGTVQRGADITREDIAAEGLELVRGGVLSIWHRRIRIEKEIDADRIRRQRIRVSPVWNHRDRTARRWRVLC